MSARVSLARSHAFAAEAGITLIELLTVITIVAVLMSIGVPSYRYVTNNNRVVAEINGLIGDLQYARSEAIKEGQTVVACVSTDGASCSTDNTQTWSAGWIVFSDANGNGTVDAGEVVRKVQAALTGTDTMTEVNGVQAVTFNREGYATGIPNGVVVTLHDVNSTPKYTRCLNLTLVGQMSVLKNGDSLSPNTGTCS